MNQNNVALDGLEEEEDWEKASDGVMDGEETEVWAEAEGETEDQEVQLYGGKSKILPWK